MASMRSQLDVIPPFVILIITLSKCPVTYWNSSIYGITEEYMQNILKVPVTGMIPRLQNS